MVSEIKKCSENLIHFAETYFYIISLDEGKQTIALHLYQKTGGYKNNTSLWFNHCY